MYILKKTWKRCISANGYALQVYSFSENGGSSHKQPTKQKENTKRVSNHPLFLKKKRNQTSRACYFKPQLSIPGTIRTVTSSDTNQIKSNPLKTI